MRSPAAPMGSRPRLAIGWLTLFVVGTDLFVISPLLPFIVGEFGITAAAGGLCAAAFSLAYMVSAPALGGLADRVGRHRVLAMCLFGFSLANLLTAAAASFPWLLASRIAAGVATAGVTPLIYAGIGEGAPPGRRASWMAITVSGLLLALSVGAPLGSVIAATYGWRLPFSILSGSALVLVAANGAGWPTDARREARRPEAGLFSARMVLHVFPTVLWATALYGMYTYLGTGLRAAGFAPSQVARSISVYGLAALIGVLLGGHVADRAGARRTMLMSLVGLAVCLSALGVNLAAEWSADAVLMLTSISAQLFFPAQQSALTRDFPERCASVLAWNNSALFLGISFGAFIGGKTTNLGGFGSTTLAGTMIACAAAVLVARLPKLAPIAKIEAAD